MVLYPMFLYPSFFHAFFKNKNPYTNLIMKRHLNKSAKEITAGFFIALIFHFDYKKITQRVVMNKIIHLDPFMG